MFKNVTKEEIIIPAQMSYLRKVRDFIESFGKKHRFSEKIINSFKLVVDEACTNIIRHGYRDIKNGQITVRAIARRMSLTIVIVDRGHSFDPRQVKNPDLEKYVSIGKKGGLGIFMMRKLMDDIRYNVTNRGNELRLTKMREEVESKKPALTWDSMTLRFKYTIITSSIMTILAVISFFIFNSQIRENITTETYEQGRSISENLAKISWEPLNDGKFLTLFENAKSTSESNPRLVSQVMITDGNKRLVATFPVKQELIDTTLESNRSTLIDTLGRVSLFKSVVSPDSIMYSFVTPIEIAPTEATPLGYVFIWVNQNYIESRIHSSRLNLVILLFVLLLVGYAGAFVLITLVMDPFHKLASWVREVGQGTVDEDELDIDASDELGEIAQAFNEMTTKFRDAQANLIEQQRIKRELQVAQEIQQMLLPDDFPNVLGYDIASYYQAAKEVGGDLFDFVDVDDQGIGICVADVSGKGVPGSMVMTMIRTALRLEARGNKDAADVLSRVNSFVTDDIRKGMFVTAFYVILDSRERMITFASAGHNPMILYRGKSRETYYLNPSGFPVGITLPDITLFRSKIASDKIRLHPEDILVVYTDGITEAMNSKRELYGEERFLASIRRHGELDVAEFVKRVKEDILDFSGGYEQNDDITLVAIKENMAAVDVKIKFMEDLFEKANRSDITVVDACKEAKISTSTYYKYKKVLDTGGYELLREMFHGYTNIGLRHLSIEAKTKIYDIIREHPAYGPKRISDELDTEKYGYANIAPKPIYEELKRAKLNTKDKREAFVKRGGKRRLKPPGTPLLTLDGEVMVGFRSDDMAGADMPFAIPAEPSSGIAKEKLITAKSKPEEKKQNEDGKDKIKIEHLENKINKSASEDKINDENTNRVTEKIEQKGD